MLRPVLVVSAVVFALVDCGQTALPIHPPGSPDATPTPPSDLSFSPALALAPGEPSWCPSTFPEDRTRCEVAGRCEYVYPPGTNPSGCGAFCVADDGGGFEWYVPLCF